MKEELKVSHTYCHSGHKFNFPGSTRSSMACSLGKVYVPPLTEPLAFKSSAMMTLGSSLRKLKRSRVERKMSVER